MICEHCKTKIRETRITKEPQPYKANDLGVWRNFCREKCADDYFHEKYQMALPLEVSPCGNTGLPYTQEVSE